MPYYVYLLKCADDSYYTGSTQDVERRLWQHQQGPDPTSYTCSRRPVELVWAGEFQTRREALDFEHQVKGWNRQKKKPCLVKTGMVFMKLLKQKENAGK